MLPTLDQERAAKAPQARRDRIHERQKPIWGAYGAVGGDLMGQDEDLRFLADNPGWHGKPEIVAALVGISNADNIKLALKKLKKNRDIECKTIGGTQTRFYRILLPGPKGRIARSVENRIGQAWKSGKKQVIGEDIFGNAKVFSLPDGHFQCHHCLAVVRVDERGYAVCENCGMIYNDGKLDEKMSNRECKRQKDKLIYECKHIKT